MAQGHKGLVIVQRPGLFLVISTSRLANESHASGPLRETNRNKKQEKGKILLQPERQLEHIKSFLKRSC